MERDKSIDENGKITSWGWFNAAANIAAIIAFIYFMLIITSIQPT